jgi:polar amino acid transport system substrate-binding protein
MRKVGIALVAALGLSLLVSGLASGGGTRRVTAACSSDVIHSGQVTVGTDNPAYPPWFGGNPPKGSKWKVSDPNSGQGFESAVAYAVAKQLGFSKSQVQWVYTPFNKSFAPGKKAFDFDINEISYDPERAKVVDFSDSYYDVNQAIVVRKGTPIAKVHTIAGLKPYKLGAQLGTTSYKTIVNVIKPSSKAVYSTNDKAVFALKGKLIDGVVVDLPTAFYVTAVQVPNSVILGQFANPGKTPEHFGMAFEKGNPLRACVNTALATLKKNGTLAKIQQTWLSKVVSVPVLK